MALLAHTYGFLAVFAAGLAMRSVEMKHSGEERLEHAAGPAAEDTGRDLATDPQRAPAYMAQAVLAFNEQLERAGEIAVVLTIGSLLRFGVLLAQPVWFLLLLFLAIRPAAVYLGLARSCVQSQERCLISWFGIRGIGSLYYLSYAINHGLPVALSGALASLTLLVIGASVVLHGVSVTPLMKHYRSQET